MTGQETDDQEDEKKIKERQLLLQGKKTVQGVPECVCKRCNCQVSQGKGKETMIDKLQHMWNSLLYKLMFKKYK